jgi:GT2 family glycosyltransferase
MVERSVIDEVGVFQKTVDGRGEDTDLFERINRAGIAAWYLPAAIIHHVTPPERLTEQYLLKLCGTMGRGVALRQAARHGNARFALLWLAKAARAALIHAPLWVVDRLRGNREAALGRRCQLEIDAHFLRTGWQCLQPRQVIARVPAACPHPRSSG